MTKPIEHETAKIGKQVIDTHTEFYDNPYAEFEDHFRYMLSRSIARNDDDYKEKRIAIVDKAIRNNIEWG